MWFMLQFLMLGLVLGGRSKNKTRPVKAKKKELVKILVLLPDDERLIFSVKHVKPALDYAIKTITLEEGFLEDFYFELEYGNSKCSKDAKLTASDMYYGNTRRGIQPALILGPVCSMAAAGVNDFSKHWNVAMMTSGAMARAFTLEHQPTLTRITAPYTEIGEVFKTLFINQEYYKYPIHLVFHSPQDLTKDCFFANEAIDYILRMTPDKFQVFSTVVQHPLCCIDYDAIIAQMNEPRVVITCGPDDFVRNILLTAKRYNLTDPNKNVWYTIDLFNASYFGHGSWQRGDQYDLEAYEAYKALQVITIKTNIQNIRKHKMIDDADINELGSFANFSKYMSNAYIDGGLISQPELFRVNSFVEGFHDALILFALAMDVAVTQMINWRDGREITSLMRSRRMDGIGSPVLIDESGNRYGDYSLLAMVENDDQQFRFKTVYQHLRSKGIQNYLNAKMPRIEVPELLAWYTPEDDKKEDDDEPYIKSKSYWILGGSFILFIVSIAIVFIFSMINCRRWKNTKLRHSSTTRTTLLEHRPLDQELSSYSMNSTNSLIRPNQSGRNGRHSTGSYKKRESKRLSGHCAVERTVTQVTYCADNPEGSGNRDSGLVESG